MNTFHPKLHDIIMERVKELQIDVLLQDRVKLPQNGYHNDGSEMEVELSSGRKLSADFVVCHPFLCSL